MQMRREALRPWFRATAAVTLLCWIAAASVCAAHCSGLFDHGDAPRASCHGVAVATHGEDANHSDPTHHDSSSTTLCLALKTVLPSIDGSIHFHPDFSFVYLLAPLTLAFDTALNEPIHHHFRQAHLRGWVFTPEVSLGPAYRSLAPPLT